MNYCGGFPQSYIKLYNINLHGFLKRAVSVLNILSQRVGVKFKMSIWRVFITQILEETTVEEFSFSQDKSRYTPFCFSSCFTSVSIRLFTNFLIIFFNFLS